MDEPIIFERVLEVGSSDEYFNPINAARVSLTRDDIEKIVRAADTSVANNYASIRLWASEADWGDCDDVDTGEPFLSTKDENSGSDFLADCEQAAIYTTAPWQTVCWTAYMVHSNLRVETKEVDIDELRQLLAAADGACHDPDGTDDSQAALH